MDKNETLILLSESDRIRYASEDFNFASQPKPQKIFSTVWMVEAEVNNGGFSQYFLNSSAESVPFVVEALQTIGAHATADICKRAIDTAFPAALPPTVGRVRSEAAGFSDAILEKLESLDQEFFAYPNDLTDLLFNYVSERPEEFGILSEL